MHTHTHTPFPITRRMSDRGWENMARCAAHHFGRAEKKKHARIDQALPSSSSPPPFPLHHGSHKESIRRNKASPLSFTHNAFPKQRFFRPRKEIRGGKEYSEEEGKEGGEIAKVCAGYRRYYSTTNSLFCLAKQWRLIDMRSSA